MQPRSQPGLRPGSKSILWLLTVALLFMATPAFSGCPFRHGVRFAASPGMRVPETPESPELPHDDNGHKHGHEMEAARLRSKPEDTLKAPSNSSQPGNGTTSSGRRLQGLIGLGVTTGLDQPLARDTRSAVSGGASVPRATSTTTPYPSTPYGTTAKPTNPVAKDWVSVVSACKVRHQPLVAKCVFHHDCWSGADQHMQANSLAARCVRVRHARCSQEACVKTPWQLKTAESIHLSRQHTVCA
jgi:hypothetical protein